MGISAHTHSLSPSLDLSHASLTLSCRTLGHIGTVNTNTLSLPLSHAGHLNTLALSTQTIHKCRIKKEITKRAQFETEIEGQDARSRQKTSSRRVGKTEDSE